MTFEAIGEEEMAKSEGQATEEPLKKEIKKMVGTRNILVIAHYSGAIAEGIGMLCCHKQKV